MITTPYTCTFTTIPTAGINTVSALLNDTVISSDPEAFAFANTSVTVTDSYAGLLGTVGVCLLVKCAVASRNCLRIGGDVLQRLVERFASEQALEFLNVVLQADFTTSL